MMKTIKNVMIIALLIAGTTAFSQQRNGANPKESGAPRQMPEKSAIAQLNLSADQQARLGKIRKDYHQKDSIAFVEFTKKREQVKVERMNAFKSVLNKEQLEKFDKALLMRADQAIFQGQNRPAGMHQRGPGNQNMNRRGMSNQRQHFQGNFRHQAMGMQSRHFRMQKAGRPNAMGMQARTQFRMHKEGMYAQRMGYMSSMQNGKRGQMPMAKMSPEQHAQKQSEHMTKMLSLNEKQTALIQDINLKYAQKESLSKSDKGAYKEAMASKQKEIRSVLNDDQKVKFDNLMDKGKKEMPGSEIESKQQPQPLK